MKKLPTKMREIRKELGTVLERFGDPKWWYHNKRGVQAQIKENPRILPVLKDLINSDKKYSVLKLLEKLEERLEDDEVCRFLEAKSNVNQYIYELLYNLYRKQLVSNNAFAHVKERFKIMKDYEKMYNDIECRYCLKKIEMDRYYFKKKKEEEMKVKDRRMELFTLIETLPSLKVGDLGPCKSASNNVNNVFVINIDNIFSLKGDNSRLGEEVDTLYRIVNMYKTKYFRYKEDVYFNLTSLDENFQSMGGRFQSFVSDNLHRKRARICGIDKDLKRTIDEYVHIYTSRHLRKYVDRRVIHKLNDTYRYRFSGLKATLQTFKEGNCPVYAISKYSLSNLLSEIIVYECDILDSRKIITYKWASLCKILDRIAENENADKVYYFGPPNPAIEGAKFKDMIVRCNEDELNKFVKGVRQRHIT
jgi:hypothetical protein